MNDGDDDDRLTPVRRGNGRGGAAEKAGETEIKERVRASMCGYHHHHTLTIRELFDSISLLSRPQFPLRL